MQEKAPNIYVIHAKRGYEIHEQRIKELFEQNNLDFEFVTDGDPQNFSVELLDAHFTKRVQEKYSKGAISCTLNHMIAFRRMIERNQPWAVIFENDPFFLGDFNTQLAQTIEEMKHLPPGFIISLENSTLRFPSYWQAQKGKTLYEAKVGRMAGAYIIDLQGAKNAIAHLEEQKCNEIIDWWHNDLISAKQISMYWAHPAYIEQGSHNGYLSSTISSTKKSTFNKIRWVLKRAFGIYITRLFNERRLV